MPESTVEPITLAIALEAAMIRLGELSQPGLDAFDEHMATRGDCAEFDAGVNLLGAWIGNTAP